MFNKKIKIELNEIKQDYLKIQEKLNDIESFNPLNLLKNNFKIASYKKDCEEYYYLKQITNCEYYSFYLFGRCIEAETQVSPDFKNKKELYIWVMENYKKLNKKYDDDKKEMENK